MVLLDPGLSVTLTHETDTAIYFVHDAREIRVCSATWFRVDSAEVLGARSETKICVRISLNHVLFSMFHSKPVPQPDVTSKVM